MFRRLASVLLLWWPTAAPANALTFEFWPSDDPGQSMSCVLRYADGMFTAVEVQGPGMPAATPLRWPAGPEDVTAMTAALQALVSGDVPSVRAVTTSRLPPAPFVTVTWMAHVDTGMMTGLYIQRGLTLPPVLDRLIRTVMPDGPCARQLP